MTQLLEGLRNGREGAREELFDLVYAELHRIASVQMSDQPPGHTLQPTALVHEAFLRLVGADGGEWDDRAHFLRAASRAMRSILVDHARAQGAQKRGGGWKAVGLEVARTRAALDPCHEILLVHEALERLTATDTRRAQVVEMRYFGGLTLAEIARVMGLSVSTIHDLWEHARFWLAREIGL